MLTEVAVEDLAFEWPADACFMVEGSGLVAQWRGGTYRITGRAAAVVAESLHQVGAQVSRSSRPAWSLVVARLEEIATRRAATDHADPFPSDVVGIDLKKHGVGGDCVVISCLGRVATRLLSQVFDGLPVRPRHLRCGYGWNASLPTVFGELGLAARKCVCLLSGIIVGEVADWFLTREDVSPPAIWAINLPEALYVLRPGLRSSNALPRLVSRIEACMDDLNVGISLIRANVVGAFVPDGNGGPTPAQITSMLSIAATSRDGLRLWRILPSGATQRLELLSTGLSNDDNEPPVSSSRYRGDRHPEVLLDRRAGILTFDYLFGTLGTAAGEIFVWRAGFANPRHRLGEGDSFDPCRDAFAADPDPSLARLRACMEAIERYGGMHEPERSWIKAPRAALVGPVLEMDPLPGYLSDQLALPGFPYQVFSAERPNVWLRGCSLLSGEATWVLSDVVVWPPIERPACVQATSSGTAAHRTWEAACLAALYELIERDSLVMAWLTRSAAPRISVDRLPDPLPKWVTAFADGGYVVHLLDLTSDLGVPVAMVVAEALRPDLPHLLVNGAASSSLASAAEKALKELAAMIVFQTEIGASADLAVDDCIQPRDHARLYYRASSRARWSFLLGNSAESPRAVDAVLGANDVATELALVAHSAGRLGPVVAVNRTPDLVAAAGFSVVSVVAAGLQPLDFGQHRRLRSARLRQRVFPDAIAMPGATDEHGLNPLPHPFK